MEEKKFKIEKNGKELAHFYLTNEGSGKFKAEIYLGLFIKEKGGKVHVSGYILSINANQENEALELVRDSFIEETNTSDININPC